MMVGRSKCRKQQIRQLTACTERLALSEVVGVASPLAIVSRSVDSEEIENYQQIEKRSILEKLG